MTKKFKELPAFETNEFKVGDWIICYDSEVSNGIQEIIDISKDSILLKNYLHWVNFRTCRKLEEVKAREFWIDPGMFAYEYLPPHLSPNKFIKVREVLEEE